MEQERKDGAPEAEPAEEQPPYVIEGARSGRSKCKTCRRAIPKGGLRLGVLIEGPYGTGYLWHHLNCAAKRHFHHVDEAYADEAWRHAKEPPAKVPPLDSLRELGEEAERKRKERKPIPYVELDPSGRAKCKQCGESLPKGEPRVVLGREVEFGSQVRVGPVNVHPACVRAELDREDSGVEADGLSDALRENSQGLDAAVIETVLGRIGVVN